MASAFDNLCGPGEPLKAEPPDAKEFAGLLRSGKARLKDARRLGLALESRFDLANYAAHVLGLAALRRHGYRSGYRCIVFQLLPHAFGLGLEVWRVLAKCHDLRNLGEYEGDLNVLALSPTASMPVKRWPPSWTPCPRWLTPEERNFCAVRGERQSARMTLHKTPSTPIAKFGCWCVAA